MGRPMGGPGTGGDHEAEAGGEYGVLVDGEERLDAAAGVGQADPGQSEGAEGAGDHRGAAQQAGDHAYDGADRAGGAAPAAQDLAGGVELHGHDPADAEA